MIFACIFTSIAKDILFPYTDDYSESMFSKKTAEDRKTISLALDVNIQEEIFDSFKDKAGTASAIEPKSGEVLALVSSPDFDPNSFVLGGNQTKLGNLENDRLITLFYHIS